MKRQVWSSLKERIIWSLFNFYMFPSYLELYSSGELKNRVEKAYSILEECTLCPRRCRVNRIKGEQGRCRSGLLPKVSSYHPHFGEEAPLVGKFGSGTIFLTNCNLGCIFCQNYDISHLGYGKEVKEEELGEMMLYLQKRGCHNINFVTPTHFVPQILKGLIYAIEGGLNIPLVYNTGGYDSIDTLKLTEGIFDIYMPDMKYGDEGAAERYSKAKDYPKCNFEAVKEMWNQVGDLELDESSIAKRGLLVRHLVLPYNIAKIENIVTFLASLSLDTYLNVMAQYRPVYKAFDYISLSRPITQTEYYEACKIAENHQLYRGFPLPSSNFKIIHHNLHKCVKD